ncbi:MAG: hypothetical protein V3V15_11240 [Sphingorhabdus sp.]
MRLSVLLSTCSSGVLMLAFSAAAHASAQDEQADPPDRNSTIEKDTIVVTAERIRGGVDTDIPPVEELETADIESLGASSLADIVAAVAPQSGSGRGRGGGHPIILLNGQRISSFRELRNLPPEAIQRVQIFPEEVALKYGFRPDQRVINFILKENFASFSTKIDNGTPEDGGYWQNEVEATFTTIGKKARLVLNAEYGRTGYLTQDERGIVASSDDARFDFDGDINEFRTLLPATEKFEVNGTLTRRFAPRTSLSINANFRLDESSALLGLPSADLLLPGSSPFSLTGSDAIISRYFTAPRALERQSVVNTANFGFSLNSSLAGWQWALTGEYARVDGRTSTARNADFTALQAALNAGIADPFTPDFGGELGFLVPDTTESLNQNLNLRNTLNGELFRLPAGPVQMTFAAGFNRQMQDSKSVRAGATALAALDRDALNASINVELPIIERGVGALGILGSITLNGNFGVTELSNFDRLIDYSAGIRWSPARGLTLTASLIGDENAPGIGQLGSPLLTTPNVPFFDFSRNQTALVNLITGGNPALLAERRRDLKLGISWSPVKIRRLNFRAEYFRNSSRNTTAAFPLLTPEIEAAFPGRAIRDAAGRLISIDQRPVNFAQERSQRIRWGFNFSGRIGPQRRPGGRGGKRSEGRRVGGHPGRGEAPTTDKPNETKPPSPKARGGKGGPPPGAKGGGKRRSGGFGRSRSHWRVALYHTYQIQDEVLIAPGIPRLDLLDGSATSRLGGTPRHRIELSGGIFHKGFGMFLTGNYRSATRADGSGLPGSSDLTFSDLAALNLRLFVNLDGQKNLTRKLPFLKRSRIALRINNIFGDIIDVRDENGLTPLSYQPSFLDPRGRFFEVSFRKRF